MPTLKKNISAVLFFLFCFEFLSSCATSAKKASTEVELNGRKIQLLDFIQGVPYRDVSVHFNSGEVSFILKGEKDTLMLTSIADAKTSLLQNAKTLSPINFKTRNLGRRKKNPADNFFYMTADEKNDEKYNLYRLTEKGELARLTDDSFIYGWTFTQDGSGIYYAARSGTAEYTPGYLRYLDLKTGENKVLFQDSHETRMTGGGIAVSEDGKKIAFPVVCNQNKDYRSIMLYSATTKKARSLLSCDHKRTMAMADDWTDDGALVYASDTLEAGSRIYSLREKGSPHILSPRGWNTAQFRGTPPVLLEFDKKSYIAVVDSRPDKSLVHLLTTKGHEVSILETKETISIEGHHDFRMAVGLTAGDQPFLMKILKFDGQEIQPLNLAKLSSQEENKLVACQVEKVSYETFDGLSTPWEKKQLHAYLYRPKNPPPRDQQRLLVEGFYGGSNRYLPQIQFFCSMGYYVLSPVTRGAWDWGLELQNKMVGDLGGGESLDLVWAAQKFSRELDIPPEHTGIFGFSHGAYETLRGMTLPEKVNDVPVNFHWGFGMAQSPMSNLISIMDHTNVPGWVTSLTGEDPRKNPEKWQERSPALHADRVRGPLFISHGVNDHRLEISQSREMKKALDEAGKPATLLEIEGQGHGFKGRDALVKFYSEQLEFFKNSVP